MIFRVAYFLLLVLFSPGLLQAADWLLKTDQQGIQIYQQHRHPQFRQLHTLGQVRVSASTEKVLALLRDVNTCNQWLYGCLSGEHKADGLVRMVFDGPLWFKDRDVVFSTERMYVSQTGQWLIEARNQAGKHPVKDRRIRRVRHFSASWVITPVGEDSTHVSYEVYMDPGLAVKAGVNKYNRDATFLSLQALRELLNQSLSSDKD